MNASDTCPLTPNPGLAAAISAWAKLRDNEKRVWCDRDCHDVFCEAVIPALRRYGVARMPLVDCPERHSLAELENLLLALSRQIGYLVPQTHRNNLIAHIQDEGNDYKLPTSRGHKTNSALGFHSDRSDLILLLYVRAAQKGGEVSVVSFGDVARLLEVENPDILGTLFDNFPFDLRDERIFEDKKWCLHPILWHQEREIRGHYIRRFILDSQRHEDCPRLSEVQHTALSAFDAALENLRPTRTFQPSVGELVVLNNYRVMHARNGFSDDDAPGAGRLALRTWVAPYNSEELPSFMLPISGAVSAGSFRGGVGKGDTYLAQLGSTACQPITGSKI